MVNKITVLMTTIPVRRHQAMNVVSRLEGQVDSICLCLNNFSAQPKWISQHPKIDRCAIDPKGALLANAVWGWMKDVEGYVFVVDDDISYPQDYVAKMIDFLTRYENQVVACVHGKRIIHPFKSLQSSVSLSHFQYKSSEMNIDIPGVGTVAFHTSLIKPTPADMSYPWFRDLQFSSVCARNGVSIKCIARPLRWLKPISTNDRTLCDSVNNSDALKSFGNKYVKQCILPYIVKG